MEYLEFGSFEQIYELLLHNDDFPKPMMCPRITFIEADSALAKLEHKEKSNSKITPQLQDVPPFNRKEFMKYMAYLIGLYYEETYKKIELQNKELFKKNDELEKEIVKLKNINNLF